MKYFNHDVNGRQKFSIYELAAMAKADGIPVTYDHKTDTHFSIPVISGLRLDWTDANGGYYLEYRIYHIASAIHKGYKSLSDYFMAEFPAMDLRKII